MKFASTGYVRMMYLVAALGLIAAILSPSWFQKAMWGGLGLTYLGVGLYVRARIQREQDEAGKQPRSE